MISFFRILFHLGLLKPTKLFLLLKTIAKHGVNLYSLALVSSLTVIRNENSEISMDEICVKSYRLAQNLKTKYGISENDKVAILSGNSIETLICLLALSRLGVRIHCLNPDLKALQVNELHDEFQFKLVVLDDESTLIRAKSYYYSEPDAEENERLRPTSKGSIVTFSRGTTGLPTSVKRKYTFFSYLPTLDCLVKQIKIQESKRIYIAIPITQAFGLASFIACVCFEKDVCITTKFNFGIIDEQNIDSLIVVPTLLRKFSEGSLEYKSITKIISGGSNLSPELIKKIHSDYGAILHNLYGTNETGFSIYASPSVLGMSPTSIGLPLSKVQVKTDFNHYLYVKNPSSFTDKWLATGDKAMISSNGSIQLLGRADDVVVSGGINISPRALEFILLRNGDVHSACAYVIEDECFDYRLNVSCKTKLTQEEVRFWLTENCPRYLVPKDITIVLD